ncbi:hypothetical protein SAY87_006312 [Trapa incisa]|uniref:Pentatricopeptide repeat-containing protein n=1 Tax=Trapa incisa TaxID=236973 RepID=A0AAN7Q3M9_9MYRT|nr:hypothetical protein SAY87_006312 [Trapa incisa]
MLLHIRRGIGGFQQQTSSVGRKFGRKIDDDGSNIIPHAASVLDDFTRSCYDRDLPRAMKALTFMQRHQIWADSVTYSELVKCCLACNSIRDAKEVHRHVFSSGYEPKTFLINIFISMYVKFGMLKDADKLFGKMHERNVVSWTTMISAYASSDTIDKAFEYLILMLRDGVSPNMYTYSSILRACSDLFKLRQIHCSIIRVGLESDVFVRSALIDNYAKGELKIPLQYFRDPSRQASTVLQVLD